MSITSVIIALQAGEEPRKKERIKTMQLNISGKKVKVTGYTAALERIARNVIPCTKVAVYLDTAGRKLETVVVSNTAVGVDPAPGDLLVGMYDSPISRTAFSTDIHLAVYYGSYPV